MAKNRHSDGSTIDFTAESAVRSGDLVILGQMVAIALSDVETGAVGVASTEGVWEVTKDTGFSIEQGDMVYALDGVVMEHDPDSDEMVLCGTAWEGAQGSSGTVLVNINTGNIKKEYIPPTLESVVVSPSSLSLDVDDTAQLTVVAKYSDGSESEVTNSTNWTIGDESVVEISDGLVTALNAGSTTITGSYYAVVSNEVSAEVSEVEEPPEG